MHIVTMNGKYYLLTQEGYIIHSENTLPEMIEYCKSYFAREYAVFGLDIDETTVYRDDEHDNYITDRELMEYFDNNYELIDEYDSYANWLNECTSKNGTLTRIK